MASALSFEGSFVVRRNELAALQAGKRCGRACAGGVKWSQTHVFDARHVARLAHRAVQCDCILPLTARGCYVCTI